jgi:hypothetical protein
MATRTIPAFLVEYFLLGKTRAAALEQFYKDGGVTTDVWLDFADNLDTPARVLIAPVDGVNPAELGYALHKAIIDGRKLRGEETTDANRPGVSPLEDYVRARILLDDLLEVLLPLTEFYCKNRLDQLHQRVTEDLPPYSQLLRREIMRRLGKAEPVADAETARRNGLHGNDARTDREQRRGINAAAPAAALIGLIAARRDGKLIGIGGGELDLKLLDPGPSGDTGTMLRWMSDNAAIIADAAVAALSRLSVLKDETLTPIAGAGPAHLRDAEQRRKPIIGRIFIDRQARLSHREAICTVKADAAQLLFEISCKNVSWAIIDSGVAAKHPAFYDHAKKRRFADGGPDADIPTRVKTTYDFTKINRIRNFDLIEEEEDKAVGRLLGELKGLPVRRRADFDEVAPANIKGIIAQLKLGLRPDWQLIEPLIALSPTMGGAELRPRHPCRRHARRRLARRGGRAAAARHVPRHQPLRPSRHSLSQPARKTPRDQLYATESAVLAALEFVQHLNSRTMVRTQIIHGVNISMSIPHDVRNYGCGATPVCVACDRLVNAGVVVVTAAGNRGWQEQEHGFGHFVLSSITDPGNARNVITVGSTHRRKPHIYGISYFSSRGPTGDGRIKPDLVAPGEGIVAPIRNQSEGELSGTSMAAPFVSGAAAMLMARHPELVGQPLEVKSVLCRSATDLDRERSFQGHGLLDVLRAIQSK